MILDRDFCPVARLDRAEALRLLDRAASRRRSWRRGSPPGYRATAAEVGHGRDRRVEPVSGFAAISSIARSVAATKASTASPFVSSVVAPAISPLPGSGVMSSTRRTFTCSPVSCSWTGSLLAKPVAASTAPCGDRGTLAEVGVLDDLQVVGRQIGRLRAAPGA